MHCCCSNDHVQVPQCIVVCYTNDHIQGPQCIVVKYTQFQRYIKYTCGDISIIDSRCFQRSKACSQMVAKLAKWNLSKSLCVL